MHGRHVNSRRRQDAAFWASAFFATHPIHTDAVSSIVSRGEMLSATLLLLSFLAYTRAAAPSTTTQVAVGFLFWVPLSVGLAFAGLLCKEQAITVVALQVAYDMGVATPALRVCLSPLLRPFRTASSSTITNFSSSSPSPPPPTQQPPPPGGVCMGGSLSKEFAGSNSLMSKGAGGEGRRGSGTRCGGSVEGFGGGRWGLVLMGLRCAVLGVAYWFMYQWRMGLNGPCVTVYKTKGDPMISAWDSAGTVAPGVYSEAACRPNFLQVENPARFVKGPEEKKIIARAS